MEPPSSGKPRLLDQVRNVIRLKHYSIRTEQSYLGWICRYIFITSAIRARWVRSRSLPF